MDNPDLVEGNRIGRLFAIPINGDWNATQYAAQEALIGEFLLPSSPQSRDSSVWSVRAISKRDAHGLGGIFASGAFAVSDVRALPGRVAIANPGMTIQTRATSA